MDFLFPFRCVPSLLRPRHCPPYSASPGGASGCPLWGGAPVLRTSPTALRLGGPGSVQGGTVRRCQLLGGGVEGRRVGRHRRHLPGHRTQRWGETVSAGSQRELLAVEVHTYWICCLARQPQNHRGRAGVPQDRCVSGATQGGAVLLQHIGHRGAAAHFPLSVLAASVPGVPAGP